MKKKNKKKIGIQKRGCLGYKKRRRGNNYYMNTMNTMTNMNAIFMG
jgi:hypothetical protein